MRRARAILHSRSPFRAFGGRFSFLDRQKRFLSFRPPAISADAARRRHDAMARDDDRDRIRRASARHSAGSLGSAQLHRDIGVMPGFASRDRGEAPPNLPLKGRRVDVERQRPARSVLDAGQYRRHAVAEGLIVTPNRGFGQGSTQIPFESAVIVAKRHRDNSMGRRGDQYAPECRRRDGERHVGAAPTLGIGRGRHAESLPGAFVDPAGRTESGAVDCRSHRFTLAQGVFQAPLPHGIPILLRRDADNAFECALKMMRAQAGGGRQTR